MNEMNESELSNSEVCLNQPWNFRWTFPGAGCPASMRLTSCCNLHSFWLFQSFASQQSGRLAATLSNCVWDDGVGHCLTPFVDYIKLAESIRCGLLT